MGGWRSHGRADPVNFRQPIGAGARTGRFEEAKRCYLELLTLWRESRGTEPFAFLAAMDLAMLTRPVETLLHEWLVSERLVIIRMPSAICRVRIRVELPGGPGPGTPTLLFTVRATR
jgi:hypothetical protein